MSLILWYTATLASFSHWRTLFLATQLMACWYSLRNSSAAAGVILVGMVCQMVVTRPLILRATLAFSWGVRAAESIASRAESYSGWRISFRGMMGALPFGLAARAVACASCSSDALAAVLAARPLDCR